MDPSAFLARFERSSKLERFNALSTMYPTTSVTVSVTWAGAVAPTEDVAADGSMAVGPARLYHLVHLPTFGKGTVTITFGAPGVRAYAFTFGS